uniref:Zinc finger PHD-type domain-containing protein n=1 Tax=Acrobeloides nanus TaxID=290746 RepID=A0A914CEZ5_9BILA
MSLPPYYISIATTNDIPASGSASEAPDGLSAEETKCPICLNECEDGQDAVLCESCLAWHHYICAENSSPVHPARIAAIAVCYDLNPNEKCEECRRAELREVYPNQPERYFPTPEPRGKRNAAETVAELVRKVDHQPVRTYRGLKIACLNINILLDKWLELQAFIHAFLDELGECLARIDQETTPLIAGGDLNLAWLTEQSDDLSNLLALNGMRQIVEKPTHGQKLIYHLYVSSHLRILDKQHLAPIEARHEVLFITIWVLRTKQSETPFEVLDYRKANWENLCQSLSKTRLNQSVVEALDINTAWNSWHRLVTEAISQNVPKKLVKPKHSNRWITSRAKLLIKAKDLAYQALKKNHTQENVTAFKRIRKKVKKELRTAKSEYVHRLFAEARTPYQFWRSILEVTEKSSYPKIPELKKEDRTGRSDVEKANLLGTTFEESFQAEPAHRNENLCLKTSEDWLPLCTEKFVMDKINSIKARKGPGPDGITMHLLKALSGQVSSSIALLINRSILEGVYPEGWKHAVVVPVPKQENSANPDDYRPISLLPIIGPETVL